MDYLNLVQNDVKAAKAELDAIEKEYKQKVDTAKAKLKQAMVEEDKVMKRVHVMIRCPNCKEFAKESPWGGSSHAKESEFFTDYSCLKRVFSMESHETPY